MPFQAHIELLYAFLDHRDEIVERIQGVLNAQRKPVQYLQDGSLLARHFEDCVFTGAGVTDGQYRLRGQLEEAHWSRFRPRQIAGLHNGPADPAEMMTRAFYLWRQTRWPGRNGRIRYAHTLFNLYIVRCLELLTMRIWDAGADSASERLAHVQALLDRLWQLETADQAVLVRDARWLIPLAQSLATDDLGAYFDVAHQIAQSLSDDDRIEIHKAAVRMTGGHLRSQIRYHSTKNGVSLDETGVVLSTRTSNALDFALLVQDLVPLLEAYERACVGDVPRKRLDLADAICQGISPDPELFLNRMDLLGPYTMIEHLFVATDRDGRVAYTPMGRRHVQLLEEYQVRMARVAVRLSEDCPRFRPQAGAYSPYGVLYGFSADLLKHITLKASHADAVYHFTLEDVFAAGDADRRAWVSGWRKLPHLTREMERQFDYPQQFAEDMFDRIVNALGRRVSEDAAHAGARTGRLFVLPADDRQSDSDASAVPDLSVRYIASSDRDIVAAHRAEWCDEAQLTSDRQEGKFVVSYKTPGGWVGLAKALLTEVLGAGQDAKIAGLPAAAGDVLALTCPNLVVRGEGDPRD